MAPDRHLPADSNPLMTQEINIPPYELLVARRRLGQTDLAVKAGQVGSSNATKTKNLGTFDYAHLRAPLPKGITSGIFKPSPASYFLMRRSHDGYISATGMFKATFPGAEASEEEEERKYIKSLETTSTDETAGNVWIPPQHALELAEEYHIVPWIKALLDNTPIEINPTKEATPKTISPPPKFLMPQDSLTAPTPTRGRPRRSASPSKIASPRKIASTRSRKAKSESVKSESVEPVSVKAASKSLEEALNAPAADSEAPATDSEAPAAEESKEEAVVRVHVDTDVEVKGDVETTHTHVEVEMPAGSPELPMPEDTAAMIEKAKEMVEAAIKAQNQNGDMVVSKKSKRKAEELEEEETEDNAVVPTLAKKAKTTATTELKKERIKTRALLGISATLAIGAAVQYAFNVL